MNEGGGGGATEIDNVIFGNNLINNQYQGRYQKKTKHRKLICAEGSHFTMKETMAFQSNEIKLEDEVYRNADGLARRYFPPVRLRWAYPRDRQVMGA